MRRVLIATGAAFAFAFASAAPAGADHGARHHRHHHKRHAHFVTFSRARHATTTATPTTPASTPSEQVATVASFEGGVLTIKLADNSTVSGKVTEATDIRCFSAIGEGREDNDQEEDQNGDGGQDQNGDGGDHGGAGPSGFHGDDMGAGHDEGDDNDDQEGQQASCGTSALVAGAMVGEAELKVGPGGAVWERVEILS